jgi:hypothetical protein
MGGGLLQLVAYGAQDVYLTGNPQITFFKVVYRRHTNFAIEAIEQSINGTPNFGSRVTIQITRNGDLINRVYFYTGLTNNNVVNTSALTENNGVALVPYFGLRLLKTIELEIGGQRIDKHYSEWLYIWNELSLPIQKKDGYRLMVGADKYNRAIYLAAQETYELTIPLEFWFCRNVGLALPLIALQYHEVKINIEFATLSEIYDKNATNYTDKFLNNALYDGNGSNAVYQYGSSGVATNSPILTNGGVLFKSNGTTGSVLPFNGTNAELNAGLTPALVLSNPTLWVDYIFLDTDERRRFAQLSHEYLIEQLQFTGTDSILAASDANSMKSIRMNFNHPCKELIWVIRSSDNTAAYWNNFSDLVSTNNYLIGRNPVLRAKIQLNGNDRFTDREGCYFSRVQPYQHHENIPSVYHPGINVYSFGLKPEDHQPSGSLNMSRIDTAVLSLSSLVNGTIYVFTVNYNVLRILSGMGGLAYSN